LAVPAGILATHADGGADVVADVSRGAQIKDDAVRQPAGELEHARVQRRNHDRQVRPPRRRISHSRGEMATLEAAAAVSQDRPDDGEVLAHRLYRTFEA